MTGVGAIAAWTGPALVVAVVARVALGGIEAPLFVLAVLTAPLLALLAGPVSRPRPSLLALGVRLVAIAGMLGAGFRAIIDLGRILGFETGVALGSATALVLLATVWPGRTDVAAAALALGAAALLIAVVILGVAVAAFPWTAWSRVATRGAFELGARSGWTREGARPLEPLTLTFTEPHRVIATRADVYRVTERDRETAVVREWRLADGDSLLLRPGDSLSIPAGAGVRFEAGKRLPGAPVSGVAWAERSAAPRARVVAEWFGLVTTLTGAAVAIVRPAAPLSRWAGVVGPAVLLGVVWIATCWGVYAVQAAPELSIGASPVAPLALLAPVVAEGAWRSRLLGAVVVALVALLLASAAAFRRGLVELAGLEPGASPTRRGVVGAAVWIVLVAAAAAASVTVADGWVLLRESAGLAAATFLGPLLATGDTAPSDRAWLAGALTGAALFVAVAAGAHWQALPAGAIVQYPALIAAPAAWLVATLARREMVAAKRRR